MLSIKRHRYKITRNLVLSLHLIDNEIKTMERDEDLGIFSPPAET